MILHHQALDVVKDFLRTRLSTPTPLPLITTKRHLIRLSLWWRLPTMSRTLLEATAIYGGEAAK